MYYSQSGQDKYLNEVIFKGKKNGIFLDIGANDGITYSNSYFFEKELGWKGVCVEPIPSTYEKLNVLRKSINLNCGISIEEGLKEFLLIEGYSEMLSGLTDKYDERHIERIENELKQFGGKAEKIKVPCRNINSIFEEYQLHKIDYCTIDIEGGEFEIIKSIDFAKVDIRAFSIENNYNDEDLRSYMKSKNYELRTTLEADEIYIRKNSFVQRLFSW